MPNGYFNRVYPQVYLANTLGGSINFTSSGTPANLTSGQIGLFLTNQNDYVAGSVLTSGTTSCATLAMGSWHTIGSLLPNYQGLQAPQYSKKICWSNVTQYQLLKGHAITNEIVSFGWNLSSGSTAGPLFYCATQYYLKLEVQGDAALAYLDKNMYLMLQAFGGCCSTGCSSGCTSTAADAAYVMLQWKDMLNQNAYFNQFVQPAVFVSSGATAVQVYSAYDVTLNSALTAYVPNTSNPAGVVAGFQLTVAYAPTTFGTCTFTPRDRFEYSPLWVQASLVTQNADPCGVNTTINTSVPNMFTILQAAVGSMGSGNFIVRNFIRSNRYRQQPFADGMDVDVLRMRTIEDDVAVPNINFNISYDVLLLQFFITRRDNPTAVHDNDQYQIMIPVPSGTNVTPITSVINSCLSAVSSQVSLETIN